MALTGTLTDFGIADILQLIGQQGKTGVLHLKNKDQSVHVHFVDGNVVKAESATRERRELLGTMMVRAGLLTEAQLDRALEIQKRTLRRLGDILVAEGFVSRPTFREMYQLQTTETLYRLFHWKDGTYEFEQQEVDYDPSAITPIRSENVLMEGFRMVDEWPMVRRTISSYEMSFDRLKPLPGGRAAVEEGDDVDRALDAALSGGDEEGGGPSSAERRVYELAEEGVTVRDIIDRSRLGEFETCKALANLVEEGYLRAIEPKGKSTRPVAGSERDLVRTVKRTAVQAGIGLFVLAVMATLALLAVRMSSPLGTRYVPRTGEELLAGNALARLEQALEVYRLETGSYPERLDRLVEAGLVHRAELSWPYGTPYWYQRNGDGYELLRPLP
ncbi:MAG: DUF4388 domain-containing protein [Deltaproteobacteria bacterium]|nr:MAG: DUF4388 domain-containing protein [Deltaproteobacteria bacterium]